MSSGMPFKRGSFGHALASLAILLLLFVFYSGRVAFVVGIVCQVCGWMCFFPAVYRLYTSHTVGYHLLRNIMHPRQPRPHSMAVEWRGVVGGMAVLPVPVLLDNYAYIVWCEETLEAAVVDPADPHAVYAAVAAHDPPLRLTTIIATHKHWDHSGGNQELVELVKEKENGRCLSVVGSSVDDPHGLTTPVGEGSTLSLGRLSVSFKMVPGHTTGHILTLVKDADGRGLAAFTGDSLFCCGVGAFFEVGEVSELAQTHRVYHSLPDSCFVFPGHEYSAMLAQQACASDPSNSAARTCLKHFTAARRHHVPTVPSTLAVEKAANPFLRISEASMQAFTSSSEVQKAMYSAPRHL